MVGSDCLRKKDIVRWIAVDGRRYGEEGIRLNMARSRRWGERLGTDDS